MKLGPFETGPGDGPGESSIFLKIGPGENRCSHTRTLIHQACLNMAYNTFRQKMFTVGVTPVLQ